MALARDTRHLWILLLLILFGGACSLVIRSALVPETYGEQGPYRSAALVTNADHPSVFPSDATCHECHSDVEEERAESLHVSVRCAHCHGLGTEHIAQARKAETDASVTIEPAEEWDGVFPSSIDLYISRDRLSCLVCHEAVVGMPESFQKINVAEHLEEMGSSDPESREACFECHGNHDTAPF